MKATIMRSPFIPATSIYRTSPEFLWDEYDPYAPLGERNDTTDEILKKLTERARIAYALGCAEWVVFTLLPLIDDERPLQLLEAFWAFQMSDLFALPDELVEEEWTGPVRGPIDLSLVTVRNTIITADDENSEIHASFAELIPLHILSDPAPFRSWRVHALEALTRFAGTSASQRGEPVPRELIMDSSEKQLLPADELVKRFLDNLDRAQNPFLVPINE